MKYLIILILLASCSGPVKFEVSSGSKAVTHAKVIANGAILNQGKLPFDVVADDNDDIQAEFEAHATNFAGNHPDCDCYKVTTNLYECTEDKRVSGKDWVIAK